MTQETKLTSACNAIRNILSSTLTEQVLSNFNNFYLVGKDPDLLNIVGIVLLRDLIRSIKGIVPEVVICNPKLSLSQISFLMVSSGYDFSKDGNIKQVTEESIFGYTENESSSDIGLVSLHDVRLHNLEAKIHDVNNFGGEIKRVCILPRNVLFKGNNELSSLTEFFNNLTEELVNNSVVFYVVQDEVGMLNIVPFMLGDIEHEVTRPVVVASTDENEVIATEVDDEPTDPSLYVPDEWSKLKERSDLVEGVFSLPKQ